MKGLIKYLICTVRGQMSFFWTSFRTKIVTIYCITTIIWTFEGSTPNGRGAKILEINNIWLHLDFNLLEPKQPGLVTSQFATLGPFTM